MSDYWTTIGEISQVYDGPHATPKKIEKGPYFLSISSLEKGALDLSKSAHLSEEDFVKWTKRVTPQEGDVLFSYETRLGDAAIMPSGITACLGRRMGLLRPDREKVIPEYLLYAYLSPDFQEVIRVNTMYGATVNRIALKDMPNFSIRIPPIEEQRRAVEVLNALDKKIELNRQTNQTIEHIAQAIFKSWFVDFEPTRAKAQVRASVAAGRLPGNDGTLVGAEGSLPANFTQEDEERLVQRAAMAAISGKTLDDLDQLSPEQQEQLKATAALFSDVLVDSILGEVPDGWEVKTFGDVSQCFDSKRIPLSKKKREEKKPGSIPYYGATSIMDYVNEWVFDDIYLLLGEDGSVIKEDGRPFVQYIWGKAWVNNHAHVLQGINGVSTEQLMLFIQDQNIAAYITGAVQLKLNQGNMKSIPFLDGGEFISSAFYEFIKPSYEKIRVTVEENMTLTALRDVLLYKLISGELTIDSDQSA